MREYIRHPSTIPIWFSLGDPDESKRVKLRDISEGGLCFFAGDNIQSGVPINIQIPLQESVFSADGTVIWSCRVNQQYMVGVVFDNPDTEFSVRMIEQVCHIEEYRARLEQDEGRSISSEEAAREWIARFAKDFPR